jgi:hypothetical protein
VARDAVGLDEAAEGNIAIRTCSIPSLDSWVFLGVLALPSCRPVPFLLLLFIFLKVQESAYFPSQKRTFLALVICPGTLRRSNGLVHCTYTCIRLSLISEQIPASCFPHQLPARCCQYSLEELSTSYCLLSSIF